MRQTTGGSGGLGKAWFKLPEEGHGLNSHTTADGAPGDHLGAVCPQGGDGPPLPQAPSRVLKQRPLGCLTKFWYRAPPPHRTMTGPPFTPRIHWTPPPTVPPLSFPSLRAVCSLLKQCHCVALNHPALALFVLMLLCLV